MSSKPPAWQMIPLRLEKTRNTPEFRDFTEAMREFEASGGAVKKIPPLEWIPPPVLPVGTQTVLDEWKTHGRKTKEKPR